MFKHLELPKGWFDWALQKANPTLSTHSIWDSTSDYTLQTVCPPINIMTTPLSISSTDHIGGHVGSVLCPLMKD